MNATTTTNDNGYTVYDITEDGSGKEFFRIHLKNGSKLTLDTSYGQIYYSFRKSEQIQPSGQLDLPGVLVFNIDGNDSNGSDGTIGIEIVP